MRAWGSTTRGYWAPCPSLASLWQMLVPHVFYPFCTWDLNRMPWIRSFSWFVAFAFILKEFDTFFLLEPGNSLWFFFIPLSLQSYNINYIVNVSTSCDQPDFIQDSHFLRIPVNDNYNDRLAPHLNRAFEFLSERPISIESLYVYWEECVMVSSFTDKVEEASGNVLVHCLMGISRSPSVAIAYIMMKQGLRWEEAYK